MCVALLSLTGVWRVIFIFAAALIVANTTGLLPEADDAQCAGDGAGRTDDGHRTPCPPTCPTCTCAWHSLKTAPTAVIEIKSLELTSSAAELPPPRGADGLTAPPPTTRPPIV